jgi:hypothetical protein
LGRKRSTVRALRSTLRTSFLWSSAKAVPGGFVAAEGSQFISGKIAVDLRYFLDLCLMHMIGRK